MNTRRTFDYRCVCDSTRVYGRDAPMRMFIGKIGRDQLMPPMMGYWGLLDEAAIERARDQLILVCNEQLDTGRDAPRCRTILYFERVAERGEEIQLLGHGWTTTGIAMPYDYVWKQTWNMTRFLRWESPTYR